MTTGVLFIGELDDSGFNASGHAGALAARAGGADIAILRVPVNEIAAVQAAMRESLSALDGIVFVGGQGDAAVPAVAAAFPHKRFAIVQGSVTGENVASYTVLQKESAFLAGHLAARMTRTGVIAHLSGERVHPGLRARAAFIHGARLAVPQVRVLTGFCTSQDDASTAHRWASSLIASGADILFTMLNGGRAGAIAACEETGVTQIGNVLDWHRLRPDVFMASAEARIDLCVRRAVADLSAGRLPPAMVRLGLADEPLVDGSYVRLGMAPHVPAHVQGEIAALSAQIAAGQVAIPSLYLGPEFTPQPPAGGV